VKRSSKSGDDSSGCIGMLGVACALITLGDTRKQHKDVLLRTGRVSYPITLVGL
jgi:hypothetical protein